MKPETPSGIRGRGSAAALPAAARSRRVRRGVRRTRWIPAVAAVAGAGAAAAYAWWTFRDVMTPGSPYGVGFGIAAAVVLLAVMAYSVRRAMASVRALGPTRPYLDVHVYGGFLFLLLFLFHTDLGLPGGVLNGLLWLVTLWVVGTGALGLLLQRKIPGILDDSASLEVHSQRIPELADELRRRAEEAAEGGGSRVTAFYERELAREMASVRTALSFRPGRTVTQAFRSSELDVLRRTLGPDGEAALDELEELYRMKTELDIHHTLQGVLGIWLYLHLPTAVVLIGLVGLHVFFVLYF